MDIVSYYENSVFKDHPDALAVFNLTYTWVIGREFLRDRTDYTKFGGLPLWDAAMRNAVSEIMSGASQPSAQTSADMQKALGTEGTAYLLTVMNGIAKYSSYPPGFDLNTYAVDWPRLACFCAMLRFDYDGFFTGNLANWWEAFLARDKASPSKSLWLLECSDLQNMKVVGDPAYLPYVPPAQTSTPPETVPSGMPTGLVKVDYVTPDDKKPQPAQQSSWTPWVIGGLLAAAVGGAAYLFTRHSGPRTNPVTSEIKKELGETIAKLRQLDPKMTEMYVVSYLENQRDASGYMKHVPLSAAKKKEIVARLRELRRRPPEATTSYVVAELVRLVELAEKKGSKAEGKLFVVWSKRLLDFYPVRSNTWEGAAHKLLDLHKGPIPESLQTDVTVWEMLNTNEEGTQFSVHSVDRYGGINMDLTYKVPWEVQYYFGLRR